MKFDSNKWLAVLFLLLSGAVSSAVLAEGFDGHRGMWHGSDDSERLVEHMTRQLDLDTTQAQSVRNIVDAAAPEKTNLRDKARTNQEAIRGLDVGDPDYAAQLSDLARENGEIATASTLLQGRLRAELYAILTPAQREKMAAEIADVRRYWGEREQRRR